MQIDEARRVLGIASDTCLDRSSVRATFRRLVRVAHPDVNDRPDADERTARLTLAYRVLIESLEIAPATEPTTEPTTREPANGGPARSAHAPDPARPAPSTAEHVAIRLLGGESISVSAPADETFMLLLDAAHELGEISYLDRLSGLVEVIVEFVEAPTSSLLFSLQGRGDGTTEVFCTVEPLSGGDAPPADAVTRLAAATLRSSQLP